MTHYSVILHGAAERSPNYAHALIDNLVKLGMEPQTIIPVYYGDILQPFENSVIKALATNPLTVREHLQSVRSFLDQFATDIFQWGNPCIQAKIKQRVSNSTIQVGETDSWTLIAHSWGCVIGTQLRPTAVSMILLGCPLRLIPSPSSLPTSVSNFFHSDDLIASPLAGLYPNCTDYEVVDAGPPTYVVGGEELVLVPDAHNCYWGSLQVAKEVIRCQPA